MQVNQINQSKIPTFKALKVANIKTTINSRTSCVDLYKLSGEDYNFLQKLANKVDFHNVKSKLTEEAKTRWEKVFKYCFETAFDHWNITYMAMHNNKPCGIMTLNNNASDVYLDGICAIPDEQGKKAPFAGRSLLYQLFRIAKESGNKPISLNAVADGTFNPIKKYEELGFKRNATQATEYVETECNKFRVKEQLEIFAQNMEYIPLESEKVLLDQYLD